MQSHACRTNSKLRTWEQCVVDQPGVARGVCPPRCYSDQFIPTGCAAAPTCMLPKRQPNKFNTEGARYGETSGDAWTVARRAAGAQPELEPEQEARLELATEPMEQEPEPGVAEGSSPSSRSGNDNGSCSGNDSKFGSGSSCTNTNAPQIATHIRGVDAYGSHGRPLEGSSADFTEAVVEAELRWAEGVPNLEQEGEGDADAAPHHNERGAEPGAGVGAGTEAKGETGAVLEPSVSASREAEAVTTWALSNKGTAAMMSPAKTSQSTSGSGSAFPRIRAVKAKRGDETDAFLDSSATEGASSAMCRRKTGAEEEEKEEWGRGGGSSDSAGGKPEVSWKSGLGRTLSERLDALFGLESPADAEDVRIAPGTPPAPRAHFAAASTRGGDGGGGGSTEDVLFAGKSVRRRSWTEGSVAPASIFPFMISSAATDEANEGYASYSPSRDRGRELPSAPEAVAGAPAPDAKCLPAVAGSRSVDEYFLSEVVIGGGDGGEASEVVMRPPGDGKTDVNRDRNGQMPSAPSCGRAGCSERPVYGPKGETPGWCRVHYVWQTLGRPSRCSFLVSKSATTGVGFTCWKETTWAMPGKPPSRCERHKKQGMLHMATVLKGVFAEVVWPKLDKLGWHVEGPTKKSKNTYWMPPNVVRNSKAFKGRVDYFDTRPQVVKHCLRTKQHYGWMLAEYLKLTNAGEEIVALHSEPPIAGPPNAEPPNIHLSNTRFPDFMLPLPISCPADAASKPGGVASSVTALENMHGRGNACLNSRTAPACSAPRGSVDLGGNARLGRSGSKGGGARRRRSTGPQQSRQQTQRHEQKNECMPPPARPNVFTHQLFSVNPAPSGVKSAPPTVPRSPSPLSSVVVWPKSARNDPLSRPTGARPQEYRSHRAARMRAAGVDTALVTREALAESDRAQAAFFVRMGANGERAIDPLENLVGSVRVFGRFSVLGEKRAAARSKTLVREQQPSAGPVNAGEGRNDGAELRRSGSSRRGSSAFARSYGLNNGGGGGDDAPTAPLEGLKDVLERTVQDREAATHSSLRIRARQRALNGSVSSSAEDAGIRVGADTLSRAPARAALTEEPCSPWNEGASALVRGVNSYRERGRRLEDNPQDGSLTHGDARGWDGSRVEGEGGRGGGSGRGSSGDSVGAGACGVREEEGAEATVGRTVVAEDAARQPPLSVDPALRAAALGWRAIDLPRPSTVGGPAATRDEADSGRERLYSRAAVKGAESGTDSYGAGEEVKGMQLVQSKRKADCLMKSTQKRRPSPISSHSNDRCGRRCEGPANDCRAIKNGFGPRPGLGRFGAGGDRPLGSSNFSVQPSCDLGR